MEIEDNDSDITLELVQMQNETIWLIQRDIPVVCKRVKRIIQRCIELLQPSSFKQQQQQESSNISNSNTDVQNNKHNNNNKDNNDEDVKEFDYLDDLLDDDKIEKEEEEEVKVIAPVVPVKPTTARNKYHNPYLPTLTKEPVVPLAPKKKDINSNPFETEQGSKGTLNLDGWFLDSPEIIIKFLKANKATPIYKTSIQKNKPWRLQQVQNVYNNLCHILSEIDNIINFSLNYKPTSCSNSNSNNSSNNGSTSPPPQLQSHNNNDTLVISPPSILNSNRHIIQLQEVYALIENIKSISESLSGAKDELLLPSRNVFPQTLYQPNVLQPNLPFEINVDITLSNCEIILSFHELSITSTNDPSHHLSNISSTSSPSKLLSKSSSSVKNTSSTNLLSGSSSGLSSPLSTSMSSHRQQQQQQEHSQIPQSSSTNNLLQLNQQHQLSQQQRNTYAGFTSSSILHGIPTSSSAILSPPLDDLSSTSVPDYIKRPFQTNKAGSNQLVTVIDHSEARVSFKKLTDTFSLLSNAYDKLAELGEKFLILSNIN